MTERGQPCSGARDGPGGKDRGTLGHDGQMDSGSRTWWGGRDQASVPWHCCDGHRSVLLHIPHSAPSGSSSVFVAPLACRTPPPSSSRAGGSRSLRQLRGYTSPCSGCSCTADVWGERGMDKEEQKQRARKVRTLICPCLPHLHFCSCSDPRGTTGRAGPSHCVGSTQQQPPMSEGKPSMVPSRKRQGQSKLRAERVSGSSPRSAPAQEGPSVTAQPPLSHLGLGRSFFLLFGVY